MSTQNFKIKNGLSIGDNEIIDSSGNLTLPTGATINVGGAPLDALPEQSGQTGKYLSTDGADASWETITQYTPPTNQGSGNFLAGDGTYKAIDVSTDIATAVAALVDSAPSTLDTLNELAASLGDDANFATSVSTSLGTKVDKTTTVNGHALSGNVTVTKSDVSLGNVDNTSDANKPVSTAQATALDLKADNTTVSSHTSNTSNPHSVTKAQVGLGSVDNTADAAKPVSTAQQTALDLKANLASPTFTGTVQGITKAMVGLSNVDNTADTAKPVSTAQATAIGLKADSTTVSSHTGNTSNPHSVTKAQVGLGSVDNTADTAKPVSTAQQTALDLKANLASPTFTGTVSGITATMVGLGSVDNTADTAKPVSTAQATAIGLKVTANSNITAGTATKITYDVKGLVTSGTTLSASDIPSLDASKITTGTIDAARLPSYVDDVIEGTNLAAFPVTGETSKIYIALDTNKTYRWSGSAYVYITSGAVDSVAGKTGVVTLVKGDVGLGSVDNTADTAKPVSTAQATAIGLKANIASSTFTGTVSGITASMVGLGDVDNTSDASKPVSTATQTALNLKAAASTTLSGYGITNAYTKTEVDNRVLDNIHDVALSSPTSGQVLSYNGTNWANVTFSALPSQSGNSGKYLTTDGTNASWAVLNTALALSNDTIAVGESQTIPAGKQLVVDHLDVQGTLDIQGTLATVSGGYLSQTTMKTQSIANTNGTTAMNIDSSGNISYTGTLTSSTGIICAQNLANGGLSSVRAQSLGTAQGQLAGCSFYPTFVGTADNAPRRAADIWSGFNGGAWGTQYLAFGVGGNGSTPNDSKSVTTERMRIDSSGNLKFNSGYGSAATAYGCRAWVNFNGTGTVAIRASGNVSSITDNAVGDYTVNFTTAMVDTNYSVATNSSYGPSNGTYIEYITSEDNKLSSSLRIYGANIYNSSGFWDSAIVSVAVFR